MAVDVSTSIEIELPREQVAAFACDPANVTRWYANIKTVEWQTPPPLAVGSRLDFVAYFLGRHLAYTYEVRRYEAGAVLVMSTDQGPFPMETTYTWEESAPGRTLMTLRNTGEPAGFSTFVAPLMASAMRRANRKDLLRLKSVLEGGS
jgi:hypothetical protein